MMNSTDLQPQVASTTAGDDGEAVGKSQGKTCWKTGTAPNEGLQEPRDAGWYVAVVRMNCEENIAVSMRKTENRDGIWFDYWIPKVKVCCIDKRTHKRRTREKNFLPTLVFCRISARRLTDVRFRPDVYKMLTMPGQREIYRLSDADVDNFRRIVENGEDPVMGTMAPLRKGVKVRITAGKLKGLEAYVQSYSGKKAVIGNEIRYISGAVITIRRDYLEVIAEA